MVTLERDMVITKGPKGEHRRTFSYPKVEIKKEGNDIILIAQSPTAREKMVMGSYRAHLRNMLHGVKEGYTYKLAICSSHFPINAVVEGNKVLVKNFLGEKTPRKARIMEGVVVKVQGKEISVEGINLENVGQTAANIEQSTRITKRDRRRFQDGIYITEKAE